MKGKGRREKAGKAGSDKKILYYGSCWPTNMGNSFVNLGAIQSMKMALPNDTDILHFGGFTSYLFTSSGRGENCLQIGDLIPCDYLVMAGMAMCDKHFESQYEILKQFEKRNVKIIILGGGADKYDMQEIKKVREWMKKIKIHALVSRDEFSYNAYGDLTDYSFNGIDSAFFISDYFSPPELLVKNFYVLTFDSAPEPEFVCDENKYIMRAHHSSVWMKKEYFNSPNTLISDLPTDYLTLYGNAELVISDRVHACVASLAYGNKAMLISSTPRLEMFKQLGAEGIRKEAVTVEPVLLKNRKDLQVEFIRELFSTS